MIVWKERKKIIRTVLCCAVHILIEQFLVLTGDLRLVDLGLDFCRFFTFMHFFFTFWPRVGSRVVRIGPLPFPDHRLTKLGLSLFR